MDATCIQRNLTDIPYIRLNLLGTPSKVEIRALQENQLLRTTDWEKEDGASCTRIDSIDFEKPI